MGLSHDYRVLGSESGATFQGTIQLSKKGIISSLFPVFLYLHLLFLSLLTMWDCPI